MNEQWRCIEGFKRYAISNRGQINYPKENL
jgi:hypothetical protein